jgi:hypothetical protein
MVRDPFVTGVSAGRMHLSLRTLAANDNVPLDASRPPRRADGGASTRWPLLNRIGGQDANERRAPGLKAAAWN